VEEQKDQEEEDADEGGEANPAKLRQYELNKLRYVIISIMIIIFCDFL
jgi:hypothetical protein